MGTIIKVDTAALGVSWAPNTTYRIAIDKGLGVVASGDDRDTVENSNALTFTTNATGPTLNASACTPANGGTGYGGLTLTLAFTGNRLVKAGTNTINLYDSTGTLIKSFAGNNAAITYSNGIATIDVKEYLVDNTTYYVLIDGGAFKDYDNFTGVAVTSTTAYRFTTGPNYILDYAPASQYYNEDATLTIADYIQLVDTHWADTSGYTVTITPSTAYAVSVIGAGGTATKSFNNSTKILTLTGTRAAINSSLATLTVTPSGNYNQNFSIAYVAVTPRSITSPTKTQSLLFGNADTNITNMLTTRSFYNGKTTTLFPTSVPSITDGDPTGAQFTIQLNSNNGSLFSINYDNPTNGWTYTGTKAEVNAVFSTILYHAVPGSTSDTVTYTQTKSTDTIASHSTVVNITMTPAIATASGSINTTAVSLSDATATVTFTTRAVAPFTTGSNITVSGFTNSIFNGTFTVLSCTTSQLTYTISGGSGTTVTGQTTYGSNGLKQVTLSNLSQVAPSLGSTYFVYSTMGIYNGNYTNVEFASSTYARTSNTVSFLAPFDLPQTWTFTNGQVPPGGFMEISLPGYDITQTYTVIAVKFNQSFASISANTLYYAKKSDYFGGVQYWRIHNSPADAQSDNNPIYIPTGTGGISGNAGFAGKLYSSPDGLSQGAEYCTFEALGSSVYSSPPANTFSFNVPFDNQTALPVYGQYYSSKWSTGTKSGYCVETMYNSAAGVKYMLLTYTTSPGTWTPDDYILRTPSSETTSATISGQVQQQGGAGITARNINFKTPGVKTVNLSYDEYRYGIFYVWAVAAGGNSWANDSVTVRPIAGGGGGGEFVNGLWVPDSITPSITIGNTAHTGDDFVSGVNNSYHITDGGDGGNTIIGSLVARGGHGALQPVSGGSRGGYSGNGNAAGNSYSNYGGGGGGYGGAGSNATSSTTDSTLVAGGVGVTSISPTITAQTPIDGTIVIKNPFYSEEYGVGAGRGGPGGLGWNYAAWLDDGDHPYYVTGVGAGGGTNGGAHGAAYITVLPYGTNITVS